MPTALQHRTHLVALGLKTVIHTFLLPGTVLVGVPWLLLSQVADMARFEPIAPMRWLLPVSAVLGIAGALKLSWDFIAIGDGTPNPLDPPKHLVVSGLYRFVRNPGYLVVFAILLGEALYFGSTNLLLYTVAACIGFHLFVVRVEEPGLRIRFGAEYDAYCSRVPRWVPRLTAMRPEVEGS